VDGGPSRRPGQRGTYKRSAPGLSTTRRFGGRATIIATTVGEESFIDINGNGTFDGDNTNGDFRTDLPEAWRDDNEDNTRDSNEMFLDFDQRGDYTAADNAFNGVLCSRTVAPLCATATTLHVRRSITLVMSGSAAFLSFGAASYTVANGGSTTISYSVSDLHNQPLPSGTAITTGCTIGAVSAGGSYTVPSTNINGQLSYAFVWKGPKETGGDAGSCSVTFTTPNGNVSIFSVSVIENA